MGAMKISTAYRLLMFANKRYIARTYGTDFYRRFRSAADGKLAELAPRVPDIGKSVFAMNYAFIVAYVPFVHAFEQFDETRATAGELVWTINENLFDMIPAPLWKMMGKRAFGGRMAKRFKEAQDRGDRGLLHPRDWRLKVLPGVGLRYDVTRCGALEVLRELGEGGVFPYACRLDHLMANRAGYLFERTRTLADGDACCNMSLTGLGFTEWSPEKGFELRR
jgi:hypothetical protein